MIELEKDGAVWRAEVDGLTVTVTLVRNGKPRVTTRTLRDARAVQRFIDEGREAMRQAGYVATTGPDSEAVLAKRALDAELCAELEAGVVPSDAADAVWAAYTNRDFLYELRWLVKEGDEDDLVHLGAHPRALDQLLRRAAQSTDALGVDQVGLVNRWPLLPTYVRLQMVRSDRYTADEARAADEATLVKRLGPERVWDGAYPDTFAAVFAAIDPKPRPLPDALQEVEAALAKLEARLAQ